MRRRWVGVAVLLVVFVAVLFAFVGPLDPEGDLDTVDSGPFDVHLVTVGSDETALWPYTSREPDFTTRTLAINLVVHDDPETVRTQLERRSEQTWTEQNDTEEAANVSVNVSERQVDFVWEQAHGSTRYTFVAHENRGRWLTESFQLHTGEYLGTRTHVRGYAPTPNSEWTALQAHAEYWDWFRLRHTVTDVWNTRDELEEDFEGQAGVTRVERAHATQRGPTANGITIVHVALALLAASIAPASRRLQSLGQRIGSTPLVRRRSFALFVASLGIPLAVRGGGVVLESALPWLAPKVIAVPLYVVLVVGLPVSVHRLSDGLMAPVAFLAAAAGFSLGVTLDYFVVNIVEIPPRFVVHRLTLAVALGAIAGGTRQASRSRQVLQAGIALWYGAVIAALSGVI